MRITDNNSNSYEWTVSGERIIIKKEKIRNAEYMEIEFDEYFAYTGEDGYYVIADAANCGSQLCFFNSKADCEQILKQNLMPVIGIKKQTETVLLIAEGMKNEFYVRVGVKNGRYYIAVRFVLDGECPYEDISILKLQLGIGCDYNAMGKAYRDYKIKSCGCIPIKERVKNNAFLQYACDAVEIRIRMAWKPAPPRILEQTRENEPEMKVACTFEQVKKIIDELKRQGVDKAQLCLVGWNVSGHDGRYPEIFPVEEKLGGEKKLRELIEYATANGYRIVCHTNSTDCYSIAESFSDDIVIKEKDGSLSINEDAYSGGRMYNLCPQKAYEYAQTNLPRVRELGFEGLHYVDVLSTVPLRKCYDKNHFLTTKDTEKLYKKIGGLCHQLFGGFASEGGFDFAAQYLDYALYITFNENSCPLFDREIPLWQIVYHGIILSNPSRQTLNYVVKNEESYLKLAAYGGRPVFYINSKFMEEGAAAWLADDLLCSDGEEIKKTVAKIKKEYDKYRTLSFLQQEFMENYEYRENGVSCTTYSDGTKITVDYNKKTIKIS